MKLLGLDIGTTTGWSIFDIGEEKLITFGKFSSHVDRTSSHPGLRWAIFRSHLTNVAHKHGPIDYVAYEVVKRHISSMSAYAYYGFLSTLEEECHLTSTKVVPCGVTEVKKYITGNGRADKEQMTLMISTMMEIGRAITADEADACAVGLYAVRHYNFPEI